MADISEITGDKGKVLAGAYEMQVTGWTLTLKAIIHDVSNTGGAGWEKFLAGLKGATGQFTANWDILVSPTTATPGLFPGNKVTLKLYLGDTVKYFQMDAIIGELPVVSNVKNVVNFTCQFTVTGAVTMPVD